MGDVWTSKGKVKHVAIFVTVDSDDRENSSSSVLIPKDRIQRNLNAQDILNSADEVYSVVVTALQPDVNSMMDNAAHELGHVLSAMFDIPGGMKDDPRAQGKVNPLSAMLPMILPPEDRAALKANEVGAWLIGKKIRPQLNEQRAKDALQTYCEGGWWDCSEPTL